MGARVVLFLEYVPESIPYTVLVTQLFSCFIKRGVNGYEAWVVPHILRVLGCLRSL